MHCVATSPAMTGRFTRIAAAFVLLIALSERAHAEPPKHDEHAHAGSAGDAEEPIEEVAVDSQRNALKRFLELSSAEDYVAAARFLDLAGQDASRGPELARRLKAVLDQYVVFDFSRISANSTGDTYDPLPAS